MSISWKKNHIEINYFHIRNVFKLDCFFYLLISFVHLFPLQKYPNCLTNSMCVGSLQPIISDVILLDPSLTANIRMAKSGTK